MRKDSPPTSQLKVNKHVSSAVTNSFVFILQGQLSVLHHARKETSKIDGWRGVYQWGEGAYVLYSQPRVLGKGKE